LGGEIFLGNLRVYIQMYEDKGIKDKDKGEGKGRVKSEIFS